MAVKAGGQGGEVGVAGIDPAGAGEADPVALGDDVGVGVQSGEVGLGRCRSSRGGTGVMPRARRLAMRCWAEAARLWRSVREMGSSKQHMLPMSCQFWWRAG